MITQQLIELRNYSRGYHLITDEIVKKINNLPHQGLLHLFMQHTSAALTINENCDPSVRTDFESSLNKLVPENAPYYTHTAEGADDMPAHIKSSLMGVSLTIPIQNNQLALGTWQGIYLCEFRNHASSRQILVTLYE